MSTMVDERASATTTAPMPTSRTGRIVQWLVLYVPIAAFGGAVWAHRTIVDDGFIYLRVVRQIRAGHGPVFNVGQRVEAFTGPLWVALLTVADLVTPIRLEWLAVGLGAGLTILGLCLAIAGARRLVGSEASNVFWIPFGVLVFMALWPVWNFATSGLETGLAFAWLGASLYVLARWSADRGRMPVRGGVLLGLGWLVRPELALFSSAFLVIILVFQWGRDHWRDRCLFVLATIALPVAYQLFRMAYYGNVVANTAIAKDATSTNWTRGWAYLRDTADPYWLWVPAVVLLAGGYLPLLVVCAQRGRRRAIAVAVAFLCVGLLAGLYVVAVGGDYIHARLLLPACFALAAPVAVVPAERRNLAALLLAPWAVLAVLTLRPTQTSGPNPGGFGLAVLPGKVTTDDNGWGPGGPQRRWFTGPGFYYQAGAFATGIIRVDIPVRSDITLPAGALSGVGLSSYALGTDFEVIDVLGLADPVTARFISTPSRGFFPRLAGHEKPLPAPWLVARVAPDETYAGPNVFPPLHEPLIPPTSGAEFREQVAWARAALHCPALKRVTNAADAPLSAGRLFHNVLDSVRNSRVRIPADPEQAYHRYCGAGTPDAVREAAAGG
jgi:arabinofuranosyltransferase